MFGLDSIQNLIDPAGLISGSAGGIGQVLADPMDLFGDRAEETADQIDLILNQSAQAGIKAQQDQLAQIAAIQQPFANAALNTALPNLTSLAMGGKTDYQPSELYKQQLEQGKRGITRQQAAAGGLKSSATQERLADLASGLAAEDMSRYEAGNLALLQSGVGAEDAIRQSGTTLSGNVGGLYSNLGAGVRENIQQQGASNAAALQGAGNSLSSLAAFMNKYKGK